MNIKEIGNVFHCDCVFSWHRGKNGNHNCADGLREKVRQLAAENVALKSAITDHSHSVHFCEVCGKDDPCSTDDVCYALKDIPATDAYLAGIKADAITASLDACSDYLETDCVMDRLDISYEEAEKRTSGAIEFHDAMVDFANQLREGADK
ncbi:hypothetical protein J8975_20420 [Klebsiella pneumoniae]|uniref:hypothetical protein n=1 Tax=Klebsiella pneumoniae TaxID=573 RepID=UPI000813C25E|nr:hypothetical protein [Klebsiella pneumoniae]HCA3524010.1 hypothetical protein [Klebsiella quasipneumoniae]HCM2944383.1 hypothetical protein [Klebsiella quasipneumoniae subsp. similipneumoniae]MCQ0548331.1 hypothetical protein [Klebsiella pneumoniae]MDF9380671.1 hypothetical protein [Klebsiella pneumoniae]HBR6060780.1 hypothetical protein [Klebsiella pneumoniae]